MKGVILHGGSGTRLRPLTYTDVKQLLPVAGKPVSEYALQNLIELGINDINIIVGEIGEKEVKDHYSDGSNWKVNISYTYQEKPLGIAQAIGLVQDFVGDEDFVVVLGDNYFQKGLLPLYREFKETKPDALVALTEVDDPKQFGIATVRDKKIIKMEEKPTNPPSNFAVTGAYFLRNSIFEIIRLLKPSWRNELEITEAFQIMIDRGMSVGYSVIDGWWKDTGTIDEFLDCNRMVLDKIERMVPDNFNSQNISGMVFLQNGVHISGSTRISGPCYIGEYSDLENCYLGPYTSIGSNCRLRNVEIEDTVVMDGGNIELPNAVRISGSLIGPNAVIKPRNSKEKGLRLIIGRDSRVELQGE